MHNYCDRKETEKENNPWTDNWDKHVYRESDWTVLREKP